MSITQLQNVFFSKDGGEEGREGGREGGREEGREGGREGGRKGGRGEVVYAKPTFSS